MNNSPYFSIVIPCWNEQKTIGAALQALSEQSFQSFEIIVVDNNCEDSTVAIVEEYKRRGLQVLIVHCAEQGLLPARHAGYLASSGKVIVQMDADMCPSIHWLANAAHHLQDKTIVAVTGTYIHCDAPWWVRFILNGIGGVMQHLFMSLGNTYVQYKGYGGFMLGGNTFIRKHVLDDMKGYDRTHPFMSEDLVTAREVCKRGTLRYYRNLSAKTSTRRFRNTNGTYSFKRILQVLSQYDKGTLAVLRGKEIPIQVTEEHPR